MPYSFYYGECQFIFACMVWSSQLRARRLLEVGDTSRMKKGGEASTDDGGVGHRES